MFLQEKQKERVYIMLYFEELPLAEQEKYLYGNQQNRVSKAEMLRNSIAQVEEDIDRYHKEVGSLRQLLETNQIEELYERCAQLTKKLTSTATFLGILPAEYGIKDKKKYINRVVVDKKKVRFLRNESELRIVLPELLPHRPQYDTVSRKMKYVYDIDQWRAGYYNAFSEEFMRGKYKIFGEKVCMIFLHHVVPNMETDVDNLEYKVITDIITLFLLVDDSHRYLSHYMDMVEDGGNYTEIIICPQNRIGEYIL